MKKIMSLLLLLQLPLFASEVSDIQNFSTRESQDETVVESNERGHYFTFKIDPSLIDLTTFSIEAHTDGFRFKLKSEDGTIVIIGIVDELKAIVYGVQVKDDADDEVIGLFREEFDLEYSLNVTQTQAFYNAETETLTLFVPVVLTDEIEAEDFQENSLEDSEAAISA